MRRFWLALLLVLTLVPVATATADEGRPRPAQPHQEMHEDDGSSSTELARSAGSAELIVVSESRSRDLGGRGFQGKTATTQSPDSRSITQAGGIMSPPHVHPAPSKAESLPYDATAPPLAV